MRPTLMAAAALCGVLLSPFAAPGRTRVDLSQLGPQVGQLVPDFNLKDQNGNLWTRDSILGKNGAMLVFYRSADW